MPNKLSDADFDVRIIERNLAAGRIDQAQVDARLAQLEDCSDEADWTTTEMAVPPKHVVENSED